MFKQRLGKDRRGLTLIELVCAIAILSIITATVGGAMVVATNSYRSGTVETALQQEAQFTANLIESLIIDATDTVEYTGNVLTIANVDYTYEITYNSASKELTYIQYVTGDSSSKSSAVSQLLAEHVDEFSVDAADFDKTRNVRLTIKMENSGKKFSTAYNITSRNDPDSGTPVVESASILCLDSVTLEPLQEYILDVSVVGPANNNFHCYFEPEPSGSLSTAVRVGNGIKITIDKDEDGGVDGLLRLWIITDATSSTTGNPLMSKLVNVNIRRVNSIDFTTIKLLSGSALKTDAIYTVTGTPAGTNLSKVPGASFDTDYVDPYTIKWSLDMVGGSGNVNDYIEILNPPGDSLNEVQVRLKQDLVKGVTLRIVATAYHPEGTRGVTQTNKTGLKYGTVKDYVELFTNGGFPANGMIRRGGETNIVDVDIAPEDLVKQEWERNHPGTPMPNKDRYNGGYTGNIYYRYVSDDGTDSSDGYPNWIKLTEQGNNDYFKINAADLSKMKFMKDYTFEILYGFKYINGENKTVYYPLAAYPNGATTPIPDVDTTYVYTYPIYAFSILFDVCQDGNWQTVNLGPYLSHDGNGIGTLDRPLRVAYGQTITLKYSDVIGARSDRGEVDNMKISSYKRVGNFWVSTNIGFQHKEKYNIQSGSFTFEPVNRGMSKGVVYKIVMESVAGETYFEEPVADMGGRGVIYIMLE